MRGLLIFVCLLPVAASWGHSFFFGLQFPEREQEKMRRIRALQEKITDHLTEVSTGLAMKSNLPSSSEFEGGWR